MKKHAPDTLTDKLARTTYHEALAIRSDVKRGIAAVRSDIRKSEKAILRAIRFHSMKPEVEALERELQVVQQRLEVLEDAVGIHK